MSTLCTADSSLVLPSFAPKVAVCYLALKPTSLSPLAVDRHLKSLSASPPFPSFDVAPRAAAASRFLRRFTVSSDIDPEEEGERVFLGRDWKRAFYRDVMLFVGNLPFNVDSSPVIYDKENGRCFGFVTMSSVEEAEAAAQQFNGYELNGRASRVEYGTPRSGRGIFHDRRLPCRSTTPV